MTVQKLKKSILQLAVQGKLVPQNSNDEPALKVMKRIEKYRSDAINEGRLSIDKKHTADKITEDDIPYDIPLSWEWVRFADIVAFNSGKTPARQDTTCWNNGIIPWVSIADMVADGITYTTKDKVSKQAITSCFAEKISPAGTMIMSFKLTIGKMSILGVDAVHNEAIISIFPTAENQDAEVLKKYLFKILPIVAVTGDSKNAVKGKTLNATSISNLMIPLPPLAEQERIVAKIEELLPYVEEYDKVETRLSVLNNEFPDKLRKSILQQAVQGKLTERYEDDEPASELLKSIREEKSKLIAEGKIKKEKPLSPITDEEKPFDIPDTWEWARLDDIVTVRGGKRMPKGRQLCTTPTEHIYVRVTDMQGGTILSNDLHYVPDDVYPLISRYIIEKNDIYIVIVGSTIGKTGLVPDFFDGMNLTENAARLTPFLVDKKYLYYSLSSYAIQTQLLEKTKQEGQPKLAIVRLRSTVIPIPPIEEQKRIVTRVEQLLTVCDKLK